MPPPTITTSWVAEAGGREKTLPSRTWWQILFSSPSMVGATSAGAANKVASSGHPEATAPATKLDEVPVIRTHN